MPLSKKGKTIMQKFVERYGERAKRVFYGKENSDPKFAKAVKK